MMKFKYFSMVLCLASVSAAHAGLTNINNRGGANLTTLQDNTSSCTGIVKASNGETIIGASITIKGQSKGTISDMNGNFKLPNVPKGAKIVISYVGFISQEVVWNGTPLNITLKDNTQDLSELVVVGYGTQKKANLSGAVAQVSSEELNNRPITNVSSGLQGLMPGVTVTSNQGRPGEDGSNIRIRGVGTLNNASPYILIDGIESGSMNDIDPNDIESISVLKDASSAAIYGSKASNGVILITTKRGKSGKPKVSYNGYVGVENATSMIERVSSADYARLFNRIDENNGQPHRYSDEDIRLFEDGSDPYGHPNTNWNDAAYQTGFIHKHNVNVNGGTENTKYMASVGYLGQTGILPNSERKQFNGRINLDMDISKRLKVRLNMSYIKNDYKDANSSYYGGSSDQIIRQLNILSPMIPIKNEDGTYGATNDGNPIAWLDSGQTVDKYNQNFTGLLGFDYKFFDFLTFTANGSYTNNDQYYNAFVKKIDNDPAQKTRKSSLTESFTKWDRYNLDLLLNFNKQFGSHTLSAMLGYHVETYNVRYNTMYRENFASNELTDMNGGDAATQTNGGYSRELNMLSYFGRINYDYKNKYLLEANFRADASSRFAPGNRWGYFPSFSAAWRLTEESFMESARDSWLTMLKLRASWGQLGNQDALGDGSATGGDFYPWLNTYATGGNYPFDGKLTNGFYQSSYKISTLSWEKSTTLGIGFDAILFRKFNVSFDYYDRKTTDIIMDVSVPKEFALSAYKDNIGQMRNRGVELQIGYNDQWKDWRLSVTGSFAYNKNTIESLGGVDRMTDGNYLRKVGSPIHSWYVYRTDGFFQSDEEAKAWQDKYSGQDGYPFGKDFKGGDLKYVDTNGDGKITADDRELYKTSDPKYTFGLNATVGYKNFDLTMVFTGAAGVGYAFTKEAFGEFSGSAGHPSTAWLDSWTPENKNASMPRVAEARQSNSEASVVLSDFWIINTSYVRMKTLQFGYNLPKSWLSKIGIQNLRIYYSGENLLTFDKMPINVDPETVSERLSSYPLNKVHSIGVNISF